MKKRLSDYQRSEMYRMYGNGMPIRDIASEIGLSYSIVYQLTVFTDRLKERGISSMYEYYKRWLDHKEPSKENIKFGKIIIRRLKEIGENQTWLAREAGLTRQGISLLTRGERKPTKNSIEKILEALDIST